MAPNGTKPPKGWLITGIVLLLLALAGCGGGALGCRSFVSEIQDLVDQGGRIPDGGTSRFTAHSSVGAILATRSDTTCRGEDDQGGEMKLNAPSSTTEGTFQTNDVTFRLRYIFDTVEGRTYSVTCTSPEATGEFLVVPFPGFGSLFAGLGGVAGGILAFVIGVICVIVGLVKRSGWRKRNATQVVSGPETMTPPPPGGFQPGAGQPGGLQPGGAPQAPPSPGQPPQAPPLYGPPQDPSGPSSSGAEGPEGTIRRPPDGWPPA